MTSETLSRRLTVAAALAVLLIQAGAALAEDPADYEAALALAAEQDKPLVLDFFTEW